MADYIFTAPGRTEICGNHTDHQHGMVLAGAINLETKAEVTINGDKLVRIASEGYAPFEILLGDLAKKDNEEGTTASLVRGILARMSELTGHTYTEADGFDAAISSNVLAGSGLSSSAAFEVLIGTIVNHICCGGSFNAVEIAQIGQWAENVYFGKPCGLMDQMASSVGNIIFIDFADPAFPVVERIDYDFEKSGHRLCIIDSGASHADLTDEYAAITVELKKICSFFNKSFLRDVDETGFMAHIPELRKLAGDRAVLRGLHVFAENKRVRRGVEALKAGDFEAFLEVIKESGRSSYTMLQNVIPAGYREHQDVAVSLALAEELLGGRGACRVHGGGFAGTIQAFVPEDMLDEFKHKIEKVLGEGSCHVLQIRAEGGTCKKL